MVGGKFLRHLDINDDHRLTAFQPLSELVRLCDEVISRLTRSSRSCRNNRSPRWPAISRW